MSGRITERELGNATAEVIDAVAAGESFVVTRHGVPVAELTPVRPPRRTFVPKAELRVLLAGLRIDAGQFRADLDRAIDQCVYLPSRPEHPIRGRSIPG